MSDVVRARHLQTLASRHLLRELTRSACRWVGNRQEAEDIVQCALLRAVERVPNAAPDTNWRSWLYVVMRRLIADRGRRSKRNRHLPLRNADDWPACPPDGSPRWAQLTSADIAAARRGLERAPAFSEAYHLFYEKGLTYQQIAAQLGVARDTVGSRLHRARAQLRLSLEHAIDRRAADSSKLE